MVYLILGISILTFLFSWYILYKMTLYVEKYIALPDKSYIRFRQSTIHGFVRRYMPTNNEINTMIDAGKSFIDHPSNNQDKVKAIITNDRAYWIHKNTFYSSSLDDDGNINMEVAAPVVTEGMSEEDLNLLMTILDDLRRVDDEGSGSGN